MAIRATCTLFLLAALPATAQTKLNPALANLPTKLAAQPGARPQFLSKVPAAPPRPPARLTATEYQSMRPHLASLLKAHESVIPVQMIPAAVLATPGQVLNIGVAGIPPAGGGILALNSQVAVAGKTFWLGDYSTPIVGISNGGSFGWVAPIPGPGTYMATV